ncbi:MAG: hypothetical protein J6R01_01285 [Alistipes sp.]|nr:hypothetical protein [Alistipes sp.]
MKLFKYLMGVVLTATVVSCEMPEQQTPTKYPDLETIANTLWYSVDTKNQIYYDINYYESTGTMVGYSNSLREEEVSNRSFTYTFTPATDDIPSIVNVAFDDGQFYGGFTIPKGNFQVNNEDVYWIQLYEVDKEGNVIYDIHGNMKSTILMWMK